MHFDAIAGKISNYEPGNERHHLSALCSIGVSIWNNFFYKNLFSRYFSLYSLSDRINEIFLLSFLVNFFTASVLICFLGFQMSVGASYFYLFKLAFFLMMMLTQGFFLCHYSQKLTDASHSVADAAYNQNWRKADIRYQKMLILIAERAQKPVYFKASSLVPVSRRTLTLLMRLSYKLFAFLRLMYAQ
ncbi:odorant receptor 85b-like [Musca autumnalis]|uniref:odorant receptor 85b-like n=1 Tax=Musca autumnalis TaxID=221902 RepID=UPI003CFB40E8